MSGRKNCPRVGVLLLDGGSGGSGGNGAHRPEGCEVKMQGRLERQELEDPGDPADQQAASVPPSQELRQAGFDDTNMT